MRLLHVALLYCCFADSGFVNVDAKLDVASEFRERLNAWTSSRAKRDLKTSKLNTQGVPASHQQFVRTEDVKENFKVHSSNHTTLMEAGSLAHFSLLRKCSHCCVFLTSEEILCVKMAEPTFNPISK
ncbi:pro-adrenomedullin-like isoform X3 [Narcine bancroftii]|uniref:pro-adrenomedullin-like isoform X3 n=1 Tax=Narcine bancroftii TaxID=1343680 RepID=UPI00383233B3